MSESTYREAWIATSDGHKLFTRAWSDDSRSPGVGIIHGLGDHSGRWDRVGRKLQASGFATYALDLPGHGRSDGRRGHVRSWDDYRLAVTRWMEVIRRDDGGRRFALLAHSMGALVALDWAGLNPGRVDALVLSAPPFELYLKPDAIKVHAARLIGFLWPGFTQSNQIPPSLLSHDPEVIRAHRADPLVHFRISARLFLEFQKMRRALAKAAASNTIPTLLVQGGADPVSHCVGCAQWAQSAPDGLVTYKEYPGLYHEVLNEPVGGAILDEVIGWLNEKMAARGQDPRAASSISTPSVHPR